MDKIMQINVNIGKSIPVNTIPDEFRSGNATSVSASTEGVESSDEDSAISVDNEGTAASNAAGPADVPTDGAERGSKRRKLYLDLFEASTCSDRIYRPTRQHNYTPSQT